MRKLNVQDIFHVVFLGCFFLAFSVHSLLAETTPTEFTFKNQQLHKSSSNSTFLADKLVRSTAPPPFMAQGETQKRAAFRLMANRLLHAALNDPKQAIVKASLPNDPKTSIDPQRMKPTEDGKFQWKSAFSQAMTFLWIEHTFRIATEEGTRADLKGSFFKDWFQSVRNTRGWRDGDPMLVNYIGHPMQGAVTGYIYVHNDPKSIRQEFDISKNYFKSRMKAMLFSTIYSTQFELGPISEASLGNVGLRPSRTSKHPSAFVDLVVTPTLGTVWMMGEDALDKHVVKWVEERTENKVIRMLTRGFLNPSRSMANVLRGRWMWYRDGRGL